MLNFNRFSTVVKFSLTLVLALFLQNCKKSTDPTTPVTPATNPTYSDIPSAWAALTLKIAESTPGNSPTYASRGFGYIGLTMYETVVNSDNTYQSLAGQLNGLTSLPKPSPNTTYNWILCLNAGQAYILKSIYENTSADNIASIDQLESSVVTTIKRTETQAVVDSSIAYGQRVAMAIVEWSKTDGGYLGYKKLVDASYVIPNNQWNWVRPTFSQSGTTLPLHPHWGDNRNFVPANTALPIPAQPIWSTDSTSDYYQQMKAVYTKNKILTEEEKRIALWWVDDPSFSFTPPGHSYSLANIAVKKAQPTSLVQNAQTFAKVGMSIADAFVNCWRCKYKYVLERPTSYIRKWIDGTYTQFWPEPVFPAFYSGHSVQSAATATALESIYGTNFAFTDDSHAGNAAFVNPTINNGQPINYVSRSYSSFMAAAQESGYSRILGGIHNKYDNEVGLAQGILIGQNVNNLKWKK